MSAIQLVVFDIAGTTVRDKGNVADSFIAAFHEFGFDMPRADVQKAMGFRKMDAIRMLLDKFYPGAVGGSSFIEKASSMEGGRSAGKATAVMVRPDELVTGIHNRFIDRMIGFYAGDEELEALPHAEEVFSKLQRQGIRIALNTGFTRAVADTLLHRLQWDNGYNRIDRVICSDEVPMGRPYPDMIRALMTALDISSPSQVLKIGDTEVDVEEGRNAGCGIVVGVTTGAFTRAELEPYHPDYIIDDLAELMPIIEKAATL